MRSFPYQYKKILLILYINRHLFRSENLSIIILYNIMLSVLCALLLDRKLLIIHINNTAYASIWRENALYTLFDFKREFICGLSKKHTGFNLSKTTLQFCILCLLIVHFLCLLVIIYKSRTSSLLLLHKRDEIKNNVNDNINYHIHCTISDRTNDN